MKKKELEKQLEKIFKKKKYYFMVGVRFRLWEIIKLPHIKEELFDEIIKLLTKNTKKDE